MKFKAVVTVLAQRQRVRRDDGEEDEEDEEDEMADGTVTCARMYSGALSYLRALSARTRVEGVRCFIYNLFISSSARGPADLCM